LTREVRYDEVVYGEAADSGLTAAQLLQSNLRGRPYRHYDCAGLSDQSDA